MMNDPSSNENTAAPQGDAENVNNNTKPDDNTDTDENEIKIDPVTALQDTIDSFFLTLFEALRSTRSAVTPEGLASGADNSSNYPEYEEFLTQLQNEEDPATSLLLSLKSKEGSETTALDIIPRNGDEYAKLLEQVEKNKDEELVSRLAQNVLDISAEVDERVCNLPGIHMMKDQQMERIKVLLNDNKDAADDLDTVYKEAEDKLKKVRNVLQKETCSVLGIEEEL